MKKTYDFRGLDVWNEDRLVNQAPLLTLKYQKDGTAKYDSKKEISTNAWARVVADSRQKISDEKKLNKYLSFYLSNMYYVNDVERYVVDNKKKSKSQIARDYASEIVAKYKPILADKLTPYNKDIDIVVVAYKCGLIDSDELYACIKEYVWYLVSKFESSQYGGNGYASDSKSSELGTVWTAMYYLIDKYDNRKDGFINYVNKYFSSVSYRRSIKKSIKNGEKIVDEYLSKKACVSSQHIEVSAEIEQLLSKLSDTERDVIIMWHIEGLRRNDISEKLSIPTGAVSSINNKALFKLRDLYVDYVQSGNNYGFNTFSYYDNCKTEIEKED